jgi:hypothetical protein
MVQKQEPKQYMIFIYGNYKDKDKIVELIAIQISAFTDPDTYVKYNYGDYGVVMNFQSEYNFYQLRDNIHIVLEKAVDQYFLMEVPNAMYAFMPPEMKLNLFDLNEENHNFEDKENKEKPDVNILDKFIFNIASSLMPEDMLSEEDMDKMFENIMLKVSNKDPKQKPTIDDILDKIQDNGFDSLTNFEKQILDEYSKN